MDTQEERIKRLKERRAFELLNIDSGTDLIEAERERQLNEEGHTREEDLLYKKDELVTAAIAYLSSRKDLWPFGRYSFKPKGRLENLIRAGALIAAEIDRYQYKKHKGKEDDTSEDDCHGVDPIGILQSPIRSTSRAYRLDDTIAVEFTDTDIPGRNYYTLTVSPLSRDEVSSDFQDNTGLHDTDL